MTFLTIYRARVMDTRKERLRFSYPFRIHTTASGLYRTLVPAGFLPDVQKAIPVAEMNTGTSISIIPRKRSSEGAADGDFFVLAPTLVALRKALDTSLAMQAMRQTSMSIVIAFALHSNYSVYEHSADNRIFPSMACLVDLPENAGVDYPDFLHGWRRKFNRSEPKSSGLCLALKVAVYSKTTITCGGDTEVAYARVENSKACPTPGREVSENLGPYAKLLNEYDTHPIEDLNYRAGNEIPYTEEAAKFFYEIMQNMTRLAITLQDYLDHQGVAEEYIGINLESPPAQGSPVLGLIPGKDERTPE